MDFSSQYGGQTLVPLGKGYGVSQGVGYNEADAIYSDGYGGYVQGGQISHPTPLPGQVDQTSQYMVIGPTTSFTGTKIGPGASTARLIEGSASFAFVDDVATGAMHAGGSPRGGTITPLSVTTTATGSQIFQPVQQPTYTDTQVSQNDFETLQNNGLLFTQFGGTPQDQIPQYTSILPSAMQPFGVYQQQNVANSDIHTYSAYSTQQPSQQQSIGNDIHTYNPYATQQEPQLQAAMQSFGPSPAMMQIPIHTGPTLPLGPVFYTPNGPASAPIVDVNGGCQPLQMQHPQPNLSTVPPPFQHQSHSFSGPAIRSFVYPPQEPSLLHRMNPPPLLQETQRGSEQVMVVITLEYIRDLTKTFYDWDNVEFSILPIVSDLEEQNEKYKVGPFVSNAGKNSNLVDCDLLNKELRVPLKGESTIRLKVLEESEFRSDLVGTVRLVCDQLVTTPRKFPIVGTSGQVKGFLSCTMRQQTFNPAIQQVNPMEQYQQQNNMSSFYLNDQLQNDIYVNGHTHTQTGMSGGLTDRMLMYERPPQNETYQGRGRRERKHEESWLDKLKMFCMDVSNDE